MRRLFLSATLAAILVACSGSSEVAEPEPTREPTAQATPSATVARPTAEPANAGATPSPSPTSAPTSAPTPTPAPDLLDVLAEELSTLGIDEQRVECIREGLASQEADREALESAEVDAVVLLDRVAQLCDVDLVDYVEDGDE